MAGIGMGIGFVWGFMALLWGINSEMQATTVMQQIAGMILLTNATLAFAAVWLLHSVDRIARNQQG